MSHSTLFLAHNYIKLHTQKTHESSAVFGSQGVLVAQVNKEDLHMLMPSGVPLMMFTVSSSLLSSARAMWTIYTPDLSRVGANLVSNFLVGWGFRFSTLDT